MEHRVFTVEEAEQHWRGIDAVHCKNLFVRNKKGNAHYLVIVERSKSVGMKRLAGELGEDRLSFASPERLAKYLGLTPGAVSPFGIINDHEHLVTVVLDPYGTTGTVELDTAALVTPARSILGTCDVSAVTGFSRRMTVSFRFTRSAAWLTVCSVPLEQS